mgnify:CR=1 FL=1
MGGFSTLGGGLTWEQVKQKLETETDYRIKPYDKDLDQVIDLAAMPRSIAANEIFTVPEGKQVTWHFNIGEEFIIEGELVVNGEAIFVWVR